MAKEYVAPPRVVVTGMGAITSLGKSAEALWQALVAGRSGISRIRHFDASDFPVQIAGAIHDFEPSDYLDRKEARRMARFTQLAVAATRGAIEEVSLDLEREDRTRIGVELGNAVGSVDTIIRGCQSKWLQSQRQAEFRRNDYAPIRAHPRVGEVCSGPGDDQ